tara:strand:+ start:6607 stop:7131 length:525 start_codon:yes stop_codon:yes gene_type:complete
MARRIPQRIGNPNVQPMVNLSGSPDLQTPQIYGFYRNQARKELGKKDLVELIANQVEDEKRGQNILRMLTDVLMGRDPMVQSRVMGGAANLADAYYRMGNIGRAEKEMMTAPQRLKAVSDLMNSPQAAQRLRGVPLVATGAGLIAGGKALDAVTESPEERQIREALAAIQYMGG